MEESGALYNLNKGYAKQEEQDLLNDDPITKDASGGRGGSWMSKHSQSKIGGGSPLMVKGGPADHTSMGYSADPTKEGYSRWKAHFAAEHAPGKIDAPKKKQ